MLHFVLPTVCVMFNKTDMPVEFVLAAYSPKAPVQQLWIAETEEALLCPLPLTPLCWLKGWQEQ